MDCLVKKTKLTDGSFVWDVDLFANGTVNGKPTVIISCFTEEDSVRFFSGLDTLLRKHTVEFQLKEIE